MAQLKKWNELNLSGEDFEQAREAYRYQPALTEKLDNHEGDFSEMILLEIVLWKTNRYPVLDQDLINDINDLRRRYSEEKARSLLQKRVEI